MSIKSKKVWKTDKKYTTFIIFASESPIILIKRWLLFFILSINLINNLLEIKNISPIFVITEKQKPKKPVIWTNLQLCHFNTAFTLKKEIKSHWQNQCLGFKNRRTVVIIVGHFHSLKPITLFVVGSVRKVESKTTPTIESRLYTVYAWRTDSKA